MEFNYFSKLKSFILFKFSHRVFLFLLAFSCQITNAQDINASLLDNLSPEQAAIAKAELENNPIISTPQPVISESTVKVLNNGDANISKNKKFGYDFISTMPTTISAIGDLPIPNDYKISLQDQFTIVLSGSKEGIFDLNVNLDGSITFPELGLVSVAGESFEDVKLKLKNLIDLSYIGVQIDVSIKSLAAKKITIVGAVKTPGAYLVNPFTTISNALAYSGGISEIGTLRDIKLIRNNGDIFNFDLYKLIVFGQREEDITIEAGDVILVGPAKQFVSLNGAVVRQAIYEIKYGENLNDLINFGLGFTQVANKSNINFKFYNSASKSIEYINVKDLNKSLSNVSAVDVFSYTKKDVASIRVSGAIKEPGFYKIEENEYLEDLINNLEFVDVYPWLSVLEQFDENNLIKSSVLFSLNDPDTYRSVKLLPNSKVYFANINFNKNSFDPVEDITKRKILDYSLRINHRQGNYDIPLTGKYSVKSIVDFIGLDMSDVNDEATYISPLESLVINKDYKKMVFVAKRFNTLSFRSPVNDLITVTIEGQIDYPGPYVLESGTTLEDLYNLVGRFKNEAFLDGIIFTRASVRERQLQAISKSQADLNEALLSSIQEGKNIGDINIIRALSESINPQNLGRIAGNYKPGSLSSINTVLFNGDRIVIPKNPNIINILGEVLNPTSFEYEKNIKTKDAILFAGGYKEFANKKAVYVIKANGIIEKVHRNIFVRNIKLEQGDTIVVPRKIITNNPGIEALLPVTQILSDLAFSAAAIQSLSNIN